ncbi:uncharacterized protein PHALS_14710 [Plasmopara halstedii]|uniref:Uncharacterized protein n=1 Tax=Plasmopara halstedii TaxID=4781 RepID=A0A0P1AQE3_PLAHL|nr:uncharacterized protein PHALS_14710 [Plasmopara halstedii]CEG43468.1 hypothetical protein PHALS_14710 [Plasmopara halstedii]|eukprot:XP_024579837.1 hypothetical protein PHALS_14710 [Plasmopara halstedii]
MQVLDVLKGVSAQSEQCATRFNWLCQECSEVHTHLSVYIILVDFILTFHLISVDGICIQPFVTIYSTRWIVSKRTLTTEADFSLSFNLSAKIVFVKCMLKPLVPLNYASTYLESMRIFCFIIISLKLKLFHIEPRTVVACLKIYILAVLCELNIRELLLNRCHIFFNNAAYLLE